MKRLKYDLCVVGGGPTGLAAALRAVDYHKRVCIIESKRIGGVDLWDGALQSKTLWEMAKLRRLIVGKTADRFMQRLSPLPPLEHHTVRKALVHTSQVREAQILHQLRSANIDIILGNGVLTSNQSVQVNCSGNEVEPSHQGATVVGPNETVAIDSDYILLATGAKPREHGFVKSDGNVVVTSNEIMQQPFPKSIVIIGAGVIGCEFASILANFGQTEVSLIEKSKRILPMEDEDISVFVQQLLENKGVRIHHNSTLVEGAVTAQNDFRYSVQNTVSGEVTSYNVERALVSIGRVPSYDSLGLSTIGANMQNGRLVCDHFHRVLPFKNVYAVGDLTTKMALVNVGELEGRSCVDHMYHPYPEDELMVSMDNLSTIMFLDQEVAAVGLNEQQCQKQNIAYKMARYGYEFVSRAVAMGNTHGFVKLIVTNDRKMQVLGVRAIGPHASSIVELASLAIHKKESAYKLGELLTAYPAVTQGFQECLRMLLQSSTLKPNVFSQLVVKEWRPAGFERGRAHQAEELERKKDKKQ